MNIKTIAIASLVGLSAGSASATQIALFSDFDSGASDFDSTVQAAGGTVSTLVFPGSTGTFSGSYDLGPAVLTSNLGGTFNFTTPYLATSSPTRQMSGGAVRFTGATSNPGYTLTFDDPVNAVGFEVGDWGTCCHPSSLFIQFDAGDPILLGTSLERGDVFLTNDGAGIFVAALDDSGSFSSVTFSGTGAGDVLYFGGTLRYANLDQGALNPTGVPAPGALGLLGMGVLALAWRRKRS